VAALARRNPSTQQPRLFLPALLANPEIVFIVASQDQELVAGAIANHTDDVVGLSNVFVPPDNPVAFWAGCVAMAQERFPGVPMVGYEHGPELAIAQAIGFEILRVERWTGSQDFPRTRDDLAERMGRRGGSRWRMCGTVWDGQ